MVHKDLERRREAHRQVQHRYEQSPRGREVVRKNGRKRVLHRQGLTEAQYTVLLDAQDQVCAICHSHNGRRHLCIDHDHKTGKVRALLCGNCNSALGHVGDNPDRLLQMAEYLKTHARAVLDNLG